MRRIVAEPGELQVDQAEHDLRRGDRLAESDRPALRHRRHQRRGVAVGLPPLFDDLCRPSSIASPLTADALAPQLLSQAGA